MARFAAGLVGVLSAQSQSLTNCGSAGDVLNNPVFSVSPDPPVKGQPLTLTVTGTLTQAISGLTISPELELKALGLITESVNESSLITLSPSFPAGPVSLTVGPMTLPSLPGALSAKGRIHGAIDSQTSFFCADVDLALSSDTSSENLVASAATCPEETSNPHITDVVTSTAADGTETLAFTLDENLSSITVKADIKAKALFISIPVALTVPVSVSPAFSMGSWVLTSKDLQATSTPTSLSASGAVSVSGIVDVTDANGEELFCVPVTGSTAAQLALTLTDCPEQDAAWACAESSCGSQMSGCSGDSSCASAMACLKSCGCGDEDCGNACVAGATITPAVISVMMCLQKNCDSSTTAKAFEVVV